MWSGRIRFKLISLSDSYDAICMSAAIGGGDIPVNSVYEMLRFTKPGLLVKLSSTVVFLYGL